MSNYKTGRDYRVHTIKLFEQFVPKELHADFDDAINQLVTEMCSEQNKAMSGLNEYRNQRSRVIDYNNNLDKGMKDV